MQSRLRSTFWSNRSISFLGRVYAYRKGEAGMSLPATVWITAPTIAECAVTTYCCPLNEGPHRERPFWKNRKALANYCGKFALNWMLQGNQACSASRSNKFTDVNKPGLGEHRGVRECTEEVPQGTRFAGDSWQEGGCPPSEVQVPFPQYFDLHHARSTGQRERMSTWIVCPASCIHSLSWQIHIFFFLWTNTNCFVGFLNTILIPTKTYLLWETGPKLEMIAASNLIYTKF